MSGNAPTVAVRITCPAGVRNTTLPGSVFVAAATATAIRFLDDTATLVTLPPYAASDTRRSRYGWAGFDTSTMSSDTSSALVTYSRSPRSAAVSPAVPWPA